MAESVSDPLFRVAEDVRGDAPVLSYAVEDPTSFPGRSYIALDFGAANSPFREVLTQTAEDEKPRTLAASRDLRAVGLMAQPASRLLDDGPTTRASMMMRDDDDWGPGPRPIEDIEEPEAFLQVVSPVEGSMFSSGPNGMELTIEVEVSYTNARGSAIPPSIRLVVNRESHSAAQVQTSGLVRRYRAAVNVVPGSVQISASVDFRGQAFAVVAPRNVVVQLAETHPTHTADTAPPTVTIDTPAPGSVFMLSSSSSASVTVSGTATDDRGPVADVQLRVGSDAVDVPVHNGRWSHVLQLKAAGSYLLTVTGSDAEKNVSSQVARTVEVTPKAEIQRYRLMIVECLRLTNFLGDYGAGRVVQTFSLLPGEKTDITIRSFNTESVSSTQTSSIFDSYSSTTGDELTTAVSNEDTTRSSQEEALKASVNVKAGATWALGSASVEAGLAYNTASAREQATKNVTNAASRHAAEISAKRDVKVDTTKVVTTTSESERTVVRHLENTNLSRTLNFVFRQMTQEFVSIVHLVDVRIALVTEYFEADTGERVWHTPEGSAQPTPKIGYEEASLPEMPSLLRRVCKSPEQVERVQRTVYRQLDAVFDAQGNQVEILSRAVRSVPERDPMTFAKTGQVNEISWVRFDPNLRQSWPPSDGIPLAENEVVVEPGPPRKSWTVPGVILGVTTNTLRTDGVVVDAFLGGGVALDGYARQLQMAAVSERRAQASLAHAKREQLVLANTIVEGRDKVKAETYALLFPSANGDADHS